MTETTTGTGEPLDTAAPLADLADWWATPRPDKFSGKVPGRIAGSEWDQEIPEGTQNPYWEIIRQLPLDGMGAGMPWRTRPEPSTHVILDGHANIRYFADRFALCGTYSWSICSPGDIAWLKDILAGRGVVEAGAGTGYWAWQMEQAGIYAAAYEPNEPGQNGFARREWTTVLRDDHTAVKHHPDRALFLCWPSYSEPWAAQSLACYSGDLLIYAGEGEGGCTADDEFFKLLDAEWDEIDGSPSHISYCGIHCYLTAYRRRA